MDCRVIEFSAEKSLERITRARQVFPRGVLDKVLAFFSISLLEAKRRSVTDMVGMPDESVKTVLRDRRCSGVGRLPEACGAGLRLEVDEVPDLACGLTDRFGSLGV